MLKFPSLLSVGTVFPGLLTLAQFFPSLPIMPGQIFPSLLKVPAAAAPRGAGVSCSTSRRPHLLSGGPWLLLVRVLTLGRGRG